MRKILLTSSGFENQRIMALFRQLLGKEPGSAKALFIPTAAIDADAIAVLPKCMNDLLSAGIPAANIAVFDLHRNMPYEELCAYDVVYFTGGNPGYLLRRVNDSGFAASLGQYLDRGGLYVGVSAGSVIATQNLPDNLGYINCTLAVHRQIGTKGGKIDTSHCPHIELTGNNVILIMGDAEQVVE
jgi:peptidase E